MKKFLISAAAVGLMAGVAVADEANAPTLMTDAQMDNMVAAGSIRHPDNGETLFQLYGVGTKYIVKAGKADVDLGDIPTAPDQGMCNGLAGLAGGEAC